MKHATECKFCHCRLLITIDDEYAALGDPLKLLKLAACNRCADLRTRKRNLEDSIGRLCNGLAQYRPEAPASEQDKARPSLVILGHRYCALIADWHKLTGSLWDERIVDAMIARPDEWHQTLSRIWQACQLPDPEPEPEPVQELL